MSQFQPSQWVSSQPTLDTRSYSPQTPLNQPPVVPPSRNHTTRNILIAGLTIVLIGVIVFVAILSRGSSSSVTSIGQVVSSGGWNVTVNRVTTSKGGGFLYAPQAGDVYLVIDITLKNTASTAQTSSMLAQWKLRDAQGKSYDEDIFYSTKAPEGSIGSGQQVRGPLAYEVPQNIHSFTLQFTPVAGDSSAPVQWNLSI